MTDCAMSKSQSWWGPETGAMLGLWHHWSEKHEACGGFVSSDFSRSLKLWVLRALQIYFFALFFEDCLKHLLHSGDNTPPIFPFLCLGPKCVFELCREAGSTGAFFCMNCKSVIPLIPWANTYRVVQVALSALPVSALALTFQKRRPHLKWRSTNWEVAAHISKDALEGAQHNVGTNSVFAAGEAGWNTAWDQWFHPF